MHARLRFSTVVVFLLLLRKCVWEPYNNISEHCVHIKLRIHINTHTLALWKRGSFCGQDHEHSDCRIKQPHPMTREHIIIHIRDKYCTSIPPEGLWVLRGGTYFPRPGEILPLTWSLAGPAHRPCSLQWDTSIGTYTFNQNVNQNELIYYSGRLDSS